MAFHAPKEPTNGYLQIVGSLRSLIDQDSKEAKTICYYCKSAVTQDCCSTCGAPKGHKPR